MVKQDFLCPITHGLCKDCALYRGRHYSMPFCRFYRDRTKGSDPARSAPFDAESFKELNRMLEPWKTEMAMSADPESYRAVKIKIIDMEADTFRYCRLEEMETWDWHNREQVRIIDGRQVTSFDQLLKMVAYLKGEGYGEIELYEGPRFMMLGGG